MGDKGDFDHLVPAILPRVCSSATPRPGQSVGRAAAALAAPGDRAVRDGAMARARTGIDVLSRPDLLAAARQAFAEQAAAEGAGNPMNLRA